MSAGDYDYEAHGAGYTVQRSTDPRIAAFVHAALGSARTVLNVGAGAGSYEPGDRHVVAVEPAAAMRAQRGPDRVPAIIGVAEDLPEVEARAVEHLRRDLSSGAWDERYGALRAQPEYDGSLRLVVGPPLRRGRARPVPAPG